MIYGSTFLRHLLLSMLFLCLFSGTWAAEYPPLQMEFTPFSGEFSPAQADELTFIPYEPETRLKFEGGERGVVFRVHVPEGLSLSGGENLVIQPRYFLRVTGWFRYQGAGDWQKVTVGRLLPTVADYYSTRDLVFELAAPLAGGEPVYLYVQDTGGMKPLNVSLVERKSYLASDVSFSRYISVLYGMIFVLALINLIFYFFIRETPFLLYSIYMLSALMSMFWQEGWIVKIIPIHDLQWAQLGLAIFGPLSVLLFFQFYRSYLGLGRKTRDGRLLIGFQLVYGTLITIRILDGFFLGAKTFTFWTQLSNVVLMVGVVGLLLLTLGYWTRGYRLAGYLFVANSILIGATLMRIYYAFSFSPGDFWLAHAFEVALALDAILLSLALADRTLSIKRERDKARVDLERVDTAYKREQLLADFVRQSRELAANSSGVDFVRELDQLMFRSVARIVDVRGIVLLEREGSRVQQRSFGGGRILSRLFSRMVEQRREKFLAVCERGEIDKGVLEDFPDKRERYSYILIPIRIREHMNYCLVLLVSRDQVLDNEQIYGLREFVEKAVHARMDAENMEKLQRSARYDDLTGVFNRSSMEMHVSRLLEQCAAGGRGLTLAFVDLDYFKKLNDSMGHDFGDECLKLLCRTMRELLPGEAVIGRFGGDEFLVLLPGADYFHATEVLARLNPVLQETVLKGDASLSVSVGIAECLSGQKMSMAELLKNADISLYAAKAAGRGCIGAKATASAG